MTESLAFQIAPVPPFRLDLTCWALRRSPVNIIDAWDGTSYSRLFSLSGQVVEVKARQSGPPEKPVIKITAAIPDGSRQKMRRELDGLIRKMFGTDIDLSPFYKTALRNKQLGEMTVKFSGLKPPRFASLFEALVNGVCFQQLSIAAGTSLLNRLVAFGLVSAGRRAFPGPEDLAKITPGELKSIGFSMNKARALVAFSRAIAYEGLDLESLVSLADDEVIKTLDGIRGVGPWTAQYVLLRGMGRLSIFPSGDSGASRNLNRFFGFGEPLDDAGIKGFLTAFHPYEGMIYFHLLLKSLTERGVI